MNEQQVFTTVTVSKHYVAKPPLIQYNHNKPTLVRCQTLKSDITQAILHRTSMLCCNRRIHVQRAGRHVQAPVGRNAAQVTELAATSPCCNQLEIPTIIGNHPSSRHADQQLFCVHCEVNIPVLQHLQPNSTGVALINVRLVHRKYTIIQDWITTQKLNIASLVDTWHEDATDPDLTACLPSGFHFIEKARTRQHHPLSLLHNYGGICLLFDSSFIDHCIDMTEFHSLEILCITV